MKLSQNALRSKIRTFRCGDVVPAEWLKVRREQGNFGSIGTARFEQPALAIQGGDGTISLHLLGEDRRAISLRGYRRCNIQWTKPIKIIARSGEVLANIGRSFKSSAVITTDGINDFSSDDMAVYA